MKLKLTRQLVEKVLAAAEETARTSQDSEEIGAANLRRAFCEDWLAMQDWASDQFCEHSYGRFENDAVRGRQIWVDEPCGECLPCAAAAAAAAE